MWLTSHPFVEALGGQRYDGAIDTTRVAIVGDLCYTSKTSCHSSHFSLNYGTTLTLCISSTEQESLLPKWFALTHAVFNLFYMRSFAFTSGRVLTHATFFAFSLVTLALCFTV